MSDEQRRAPRTLVEAIINRWEPAAGREEPKETVEECKPWRPMDGWWIAVNELPEDERAKVLAELQQAGHIAPLANYKRLGPADAASIWKREFDERAKQSATEKFKEELERAIKAHKNNLQLLHVMPCEYRVGTYPKLGLLGHSGCGKDTVGEYIARTTPLRFAHSLSWYLAPLVHEKHPEIPLEVLRGPGRHEHKELMFQVGQEARTKDPGILLRLACEENDVISGFRDVDELERARMNGTIDLVVWVDRDVPPDPTMRTFGNRPWRHADVRIDNTGDIAELQFRLARLLSALGIPLS